MSKLFKIITIAAVGVAIGTVAGKLVNTDKLKFYKKNKPALDKNTSFKAKDGRNDKDKDLDDLENCFI